jgi:hypothetical protein
MKVSAMFATALWAAIALGVGCSSSSGSGNNPSPPTCKGATGSAGPGSTACSSCTQGSCGSQIASVETACTAYVSCYSGCQCSDLTCISGCLSKIDSTCQNAYVPLASCLSQKCSSPCAGTTPDGG